MSKNKLQSSPSRYLIDPIIYNGPDGASERSSMKPLDRQFSVSSGQKAHGNQISSNLTGWTPLISKTIFNDQVISSNSTPSSKFFTGMLGSNNEIDYSQGLNLTPFITHNLNNGGSNSVSSNGLNNITPFNERGLHLADFFMDTPIKQTPVKDIDTITPSRFSIGSERKFRLEVSRNSKTVSKKSVTSVELSPNSRHKASPLTSGQAYEQNLMNEEKLKIKRDDHFVESTLRTPPRTILKDMTNTAQSHSKKAKSKGVKKETVESQKFETPKAVLVSSPSTVILGSNSKTSPERSDSYEDQYSLKDNAPPSPTPHKFSSAAKSIDNSLKPAMGLFSEKRNRPSKGNSYKNSAGSGINTFNSSNGIRKASSKNNMKSGMNKFQIVFTDVHTLMNNKSKQRKISSNAGQKSKSYTTSSSDVSQEIKPSVAGKSSSNLSVMDRTNTSQDHNLSLNSNSKETSILSGNSSSSNTSHLNFSATEHTSFEIGGLSSTPNGKYVLDKVFDKNSPHGYQWQTYSGMPPPSQGTRIQHTQQQPIQQLSQQQQQQQQQQHSMMMMMMMSTPQHQNVMNYNPTIFPPAHEVSPTSNFAGPVHGFSAFTYNSMNSFSKDESPIDHVSDMTMNNSVMIPMSSQKDTSFTQISAASNDEHNEYLRKDQRKV
ncbi:Piso0_001157 [Millerozyma farinosa CBS 7064]|uniref:Piso0_001157 protein n=1 Tax=Pichia sorbitophila (strain ATCC MYA-4447 / BCRC 22081 / CBS 7064 / NBRC 10061 / NRRL Y-12695) TaxID=559304 RepID=G8YPE6_PICSO|nr:Piso0_001157 [Millerozyma farinosa CBS 7064]CCE79117.1 Piso0_001157 [Millerozyma farinosa CBS 7064]